MFEGFMSGNVRFSMYMYLYRSRHYECYQLLLSDWPEK